VVVIVAAAFDRALQSKALLGELPEMIPVLQFLGKSESPVYTD
jgi:hypothetical protein